MRTLWLRCDSGRVLSVDSDDVVLLLELLESPDELRRAGKLPNGKLSSQHSLCVQRSTGLPVVLRGRLADWIRDAGRRSASEIEELRGQLELWLAGKSKQAVAQR